MDRRFEGKTVQITGAASGFGALAAHGFAREGARLVLSDVNGEALGAVAEEVDALGAEVLAEMVDVTDDAAMGAHVSRAVGRFGGLDVALNNAGIGGGMARLQDITPEDFDRIMAVNARGVFIGMRHQIPVMLNSGQGAILNTASAAGLVGAAQLAAYAASKHAVVGMTRAAADELAAKNIRVNAICPSFADTPLFAEMGDHVGQRHGIDRDEAYRHIAGRIPMRRVADPAEVVQAMLWIVSPQNTFMTGQAIAVDGGLTAI